MRAKDAEKPAQEARKRRLERKSPPRDPNGLTRPGRPDSRVDVRSGDLSLLEWLESEAFRINEDKERHVDVAEDERGFIYIVAMPGDPHYEEVRP